MRRSSLLETNQRLRRTVLSTPLLATLRRKRRNNCSCDSFGRNSTEGKTLTSFWVKKFGQRKFSFTLTCRVKQKTGLRSRWQPSKNRTILLFMVFDQPILHTPVCLNPQPTNICANPQTQCALYHLNTLSSILRLSEFRFFIRFLKSRASKAIFMV